MYLTVPPDPMQLRQEMSDEWNLKGASHGSPPSTKGHQQPRCCSHGIVISFIVWLVTLQQIWAKALYKHQLHCGWCHVTHGGNSYTIICSAPTHTFFPFFRFISCVCHVCGVCACMCASVHVCEWKDQRGTSGVLLCCSLLYPFEKGLSLNLELILIHLSWLASKPWHFPISAVMLLES